MQLIHFLLLGFQSSAGLIMWVILLCLFVMLALAAERAYFLYFKCDSGNRSLLNVVSKYLKTGEYEKAIKHASGVGTPLAKGIVSILANRTKGPKAIKKAVDEVFLTEGPKIKRNVHYLNMLANIATLIGLTGTIFGTMECFDAIANAPAAQRAQQLASGISVTMSATLFGLFVAVPSVLTHSILSGKADKIVEDLDEKTTKLINAVEE
ncbi:MAG: MotA/TolQ/ExbB proton channel family protein [Fibrobacterota bacterium]|jgi:biopolymer transport protein ExbB